MAPDQPSKSWLLFELAACVATGLVVGFLPAASEPAPSSLTSANTVSSQGVARPQTAKLLDTSHNVLPPALHQTSPEHMMGPTPIPKQRSTSSDGSVAQALRPESPAGGAFFAVVGVVGAVLAYLGLPRAARSRQRSISAMFTSGTLGIVIVYVPWWRAECGRGPYAHSGSSGMWWSSDTTRATQIAVAANRRKSSS